MQIDRNGVVVDKVLLWAIHSDIWKLLAPAGRALLLPESVLGSGAQSQLSYPSAPRNIPRRQVLVMCLPLKRHFCVNQTPNPGSPRW